MSAVQRSTPGEGGLDAEAARPTQSATLRLCIVEHSANVAHDIDAALRDAGIATRVDITDDPVYVHQLIVAGDTDIVVAASHIDGVPAQLPRWREAGRFTPVIVLHDAAGGDDHPLASVSETLALGATDVVPADELDRLVLVVRREHANVNLRQQFATTRAALVETENRCQLLLQGSTAAIAYVHDGMHIQANDGYLELFGFDDADDLLGIPLMDLMADTSLDEVKAQLKAVSGGDADANFAFSGQATDGAEVSGSMKLERAEYEGESCVQVTVTVGTAAPAEAAGEGGALTASRFVATAEAALAEARAGDGSGFVAVFVGGVDDVDALCRDHGVTAAEQVFDAIWDKLNALCGDVPLGRIGRSEFAVVIAADTAEAAVLKLKQACEAISGELFTLHDKTIRATVCFAAEPDDEYSSADTCLNLSYGRWLDALAADRCNGVFLPQADGEAEEGEEGESSEVLRMINDAIEHQNFVLLFQPIISLRGDSDEHYEVFLRLQNDQGEHVTPGDFMQTAIENNVAGKIDRWVILQSIKMLSVHRAKGHNTRLTINLTSNSLEDPEFLQWLGVAIKAARLPSDAVIFQVTEANANTNPRATREFLDGLRRLHCRASLSRFGLVEDPFGKLAQFAVDFVKLDGSHIERLRDDPDEKTSVTDMIRKLQSNGKLTIVPMVENANVLSALWQAGVNYIQGHYLQEPSSEMDYDFSTED